MIEVLVFYMHLVDRTAFADLGASQRKSFMNRFVVAVFKELSRELRNDVLADQFGETLRNTYSRRQSEYAACTSLSPPEGQPPKGTLYWEFSKILFSFLEKNNPATPMFLNILVADRRRQC
jgi:hypothetical protein